MRSGGLPVSADAAVANLLYFYHSGASRSMGNPAVRMRVQAEMHIPSGLSTALCAKL